MRLQLISFHKKKAIDELVNFGAREYGLLSLIKKILEPKIYETFELEIFRFLKPLSI